MARGVFLLGSKGSGEGDATEGGGQIGFQAVFWMGLLNNA